MHAVVGLGQRTLVEVLCTKLMRFDAGNRQG